MTIPTNASLPFRDIKKAEEGGLIIAEDVLCQYCKQRADGTSYEDGTHRRCLEIEVVKSAHAQVVSNQQVVDSNNRLAAVFQQFNTILGQLSGFPVTSLTPPQDIVVTRVAPSSPSPSNKPKNPYMTRKRRK